MDMRNDSASYRPELAGSFVQWTRNMRIHEGYWRTRYPFFEKSLTKPDSFDAAAWQGAILYQPNDGQGVHYQGVGKDRVIASYGGQLYKIDIGEGVVTEIPGDAALNADRVPVHLEQAENYVLRTDGVSPTMIHDGGDSTFFSRGYDKAFPNGSSVPNNAGPIRYLGNRLWVSAYGRRLFAGDVLHQLDPEEAIDVLRFRDQTYDITSQWFAPEASQGDTVAVSQMKLGNQEYVVMHGDNMGMTGILLNVPRREWSNQRMKLVVSNETAAAGPYSFAEGDWRLLFRSRRGIEETRFILAEDNLVGGTAINLGKQVDKLLDADIEGYLIFSSLINPARWERTLVTASPRIEDGKAYHRGVLVMNRNPGDDIEAGQWAWEGAWTMPERMGRIQQMLAGRVDSKQRVLFLTQKPDGNGLCEQRRIEGLDTLADGTKIRQNGAIRTKKLSTRSEYLGTTFDEMAFLVRDIYSDCDAEIYFRDSENMEWRLHDTASACKGQESDCSGCCKGNDNGEVLIPLGSVRHSPKARWIQFHIETWGVASWDFVMQPGESESLEQKRTPSKPVRSHCRDTNFGVYQYVEK